MARFPYSNDVP